MGKKIYSGGGTLLNSEAGFTTYDPAEEQKPTYLLSKPAYKPISRSPAYPEQVERQLRILLGHIFNGKKDPHVPKIFEEEIAEFGTLLEWAHSKPEYKELSKERRSAPQEALPKKKTRKQKPIAKKSMVGRMERPTKTKTTKSSEAVAEDSDTLAEQLQMLGVQMQILEEERKRPWYRERKKQETTERYHSTKKKYDKLWAKIHQS